MVMELAGPWPGAELSTEPFPWLVTPPGSVFPVETAVELAATFPQDSFARLDTSARTEGKTYRNWSRPAGAELAPAGAWSELLAELASPAYRLLVAQVLGQPVAAEVELRFVHHGRGDWLDPHVDSADKLFSHIFYFADGWQPDWGGCLEILGSADPADVVASVAPVTGRSVLMARTDRAWHQVTRVSPSARTGRSSLLVHGWGKAP